MFFLVEYAWDFLKPITEFAVKVDPVVKIIVFLCALAMFFLSAMAYNRKKTKNLLFISLAFFLFALKWGLKLLDIFVSPGLFFSDSSENVFELLIFASLFLALFRK